MGNGFATVLYGGAMGVAILWLLITMPLMGLMLGLLFVGVKLEEAATE